MTNTVPVDQDRRQAVRMPSRILLSCTLLDDERFELIAKDYNEGISLYNQKELTELHMYYSSQNAVAKLRERDEEMADFFSHLDNKLNMILKQLRGEQLPIDKLTSTEVSLSGAGISFETESGFEAGRRVELQMVLLPDNVFIYAIGTVVGSGNKKSSEDDAVKVGIEFTLLMDDDREKIIQYVFKQQALALRNRRKQQESS